jgi:hypothetical protein
VWTAEYDVGVVVTDGWNEKLTIALGRDDLVHVRSDVVVGAPDRGRSAEHHGLPNVVDEELAPKLSSSLGLFPGQSEPVGIAFCRV